MKTTFDHYTYRARLLPALFAVLPVAITVTVVIPKWSILWGIITVCGGAMFLSQAGRDLGKKMQFRLFKKWSGTPTTRMLRHRHTTLDEKTLSRYHRKLEELLTCSMPTKQQEKSDRKNADAAYDSAVKFLLERTRSKDHFSLLYAENVNYGFRRNLRGLKVIGIALSILGMATLSYVMYVDMDATNLPVAGLIVNFVLFILWIFWITDNWVRLAADAYAMSLLASLDSEHLQ